MVNENSLVDNIKIILIFVTVILTNFSCGNPVYYGPPLKVNAQLGVMEKQKQKLPKITNSIDKWSSQVIYKPLSPLENNLKNILNSYWNESDVNKDADEYTSELPTKIIKIKNNYTNSILDSFIKHKEETKKVYYDREHQETNLGINDKFTAEKNEVENDNDRRFVNRSSIITKANFSYYHPIHKKHYNISSTNVPAPVSLQHGATTSSMHLTTDYNTKVTSTSQNKYSKNQNNSDSEHMAIQVGGNSDTNKAHYMTTQVPFKPTGGPKSPVTALSFYPNKKNIKYSIKQTSFGPQKPLFGHNPSIFESYNKKSNNRIPHKVTHQTQQNKVPSYTTSSNYQYMGYDRPSKPLVHSNISPTGHIPSNNHPPFWNHFTNPPHDTLNNHIPNTLPPASYKPIFVQNTNKPTIPKPVNNHFSYKPTSTTSSQGIEVNKPTTVEISKKPLYKPTYRPIVVEPEPQVVLEVPSLVEEIVLPQEVAVPQEVAIFEEPISVAHEPVPTPMADNPAVSMGRPNMMNRLIGFSPLFPNNKFPISFTKGEITCSYKPTNSSITNTRRRSTS